MMVEAEASKGHMQQIVAILGLALVWPSLHNQLLYPLSFAFHKEGVPSLFAHYLLFSLVALAVALVLALLREDAARKLFGSWQAMVACGAAGGIGIACIVLCDFASPASGVILALGLALSAAYVPIHFTFWSLQLMNASEKRVAFDLFISFALFCAMTGLRLVAGWRSWLPSIAFPLVAGALAVAALRFPQKAYPLRQTGFSELPLAYLGVGVAFVLVASIAMWMLNPEVALFDYPPEYRTYMYLIIAAFALALALVFKPGSPLRSKAVVIMAALLVVALAASLLYMGFSHPGDSMARGGNFPVIGTKIALQTGIWALVLVASQVRHLGIVRPAAAYLIVVVGASNLLSVVLMYSGQLLAIDKTDLPILEASVITAFVILICAVAVMAWLLSRQAEHAREERQPQQPCETALKQLMSEDEVIAAMRQTFKLSAREADTLRLASRNLSAKEMAAQLFVAESTVNSHLKSIYRKADVHSKAELIELVGRFRREGADNRPLG